MGGIFPAGSDWTESDFLEAFTVSLYPMSYVAVIINLLGVIAFYSFKRHRSFPASVLAWIGIMNIFYYSYLIAKWAPGSISRQAIAIDPVGAVCNFSYWIDTWDVYSLVVLDTLIALTLYLSVCKRLSLERETNKWYFWGYVTFYWVVTVVVPLAGTFAPGLGYSEGACRSPPSVVYGSIVPELVMIVFQIFCVVSTLIYAKRTISASSDVRTKTDTRMTFMVVRFTLTILNQLVFIIPYYIVSLNVPPTKQMIEGLLICFGIAAILDGAILLFGNRALMKMVLKKFHLMSGSSSSGSDKSVSMKARTGTPTVTTTSGTHTPDNGGDAV